MFRWHETVPALICWTTVIRDVNVVSVAIAWQLLRIEASAKADRNEKRCTINAPLRLITSGGKIRLALKKNTNDGTVVNAQIHMLLEDILWVATLPQLRSAIAFSSYLMSLVRQCEKDYPPPVATIPSKPVETITPNGQAVTISNTYRAFDFDQTSHHLHIRKVDLHLCDDAHSSITYPPGWDIESGAMQIIIPFPSPLSDDRRFPLRMLISFSTLSLSNTQFDSDIFKPFEMLNKATISYVTETELLGGGKILASDLGQLTGVNRPHGVNELFWLRTSPAWVDTDHGVNTKSLPVISDVCFSGVILARPEQVNVYVEPTTQISAVVDHFQFIQLTRLSASLSDFFDILAEDQKHFDSERRSQSATVAVVVAIKQARANILLTMGAMPSPYDSCPAVTESILECLSGRAQMECY
ncbi:unnamed protein product [Strongylus vulgaris]|uniref:Uncharacterized protein n=1 Tax=Strongylus vulgaris TaxID=40348 RepID=A0A3P7JBM7_STRVU|nr:unnamed protein product [Strongylus vulgaris]